MHVFKNENQLQYSTFYTYIPFVLNLNVNGNPKGGDYQSQIVTKITLSIATKLVHREDHFSLDLIIILGSHSVMTKTTWKQT